MTIIFFLGIVIGAVLGLTGAGGGILAVPALVFGLGWSMQQAAPVALIAVAAGALVGAYEGWRQKLVRYRAAAWMAAAGMLVTPLGFRVAHMLPQQWLTGLFAAVMLLAAMRLVQRQKSEVSAPAEKICSLDPATGRFTWTVPVASLLGAIGALTGFMAGLLGVGGGFVMVPLLRKYTNVPMHGIVATSLAVMALVSSAGVVNALAHGVRLPLDLTAMFAGATVAGMLAGRLLSRRLSERHVQFGFAAILLLVAASLLQKTFSLS